MKNYLYLIASAILLFAIVFMHYYTKSRLKKLDDKLQYLQTIEEIYHL